MRSSPPDARRAIRRAPAELRLAQRKDVGQSSMQGDRQSFDKSRLSEVPVVDQEQTDRNPTGAFNCKYRFVVE